MAAFRVDFFHGKAQIGGEIGDEIVPFGTERDVGRGAFFGIGDGFDAGFLQPAQGGMVAGAPALGCGGVDGGGFWWETVEESRP